MSSKKYKSKTEGYVPEAIDADGDGLVQDGTEFERPVGTEIDVHLEPEVITPEEPKVAQNGTHRLSEGENIQTVAEKYLPAGMTRSEYAKRLYELNRNWNVGQVIKLG